MNKNIDIIFVIFRPSQFSHFLVLPKFMQSLIIILLVQVIFFVLLLHCKISRVYAKNKIHGNLSDRNKKLAEIIDTVTLCNLQNIEFYECDHGLLYS